MNGSTPLHDMDMDYSKQQQHQRLIKYLQYLPQKNKQKHQQHATTMHVELIF